ncbi:MAG: hypothetical protein AAFV07_14870 [Bacteroidota bacterium]
MAAKSEFGADWGGGLGLRRFFAYFFGDKKVSPAEGDTQIDLDCQTWLGWIS